jgi:hypothetical protein
MRHSSTSGPPKDLFDVTSDSSITRQLGKHGESFFWEIEFLKQPNRTYARYYCRVMRCLDERLERTNASLL